MKWMRRLIFFFGGSIVLVAVGAIFFLASLNKIVKAGAEKTMSWVLEVPVTLDEAKVSPFTGRVTLRNLKIANPEGFQTASAFAFDEVDIKVDYRSFKSEEATIEFISITGPKITLEQGLTRSNLSTILKSASRFQTESGEEREPEPDAPEGAKKKVKVEKFILADSTVAFSAPIARGVEVSYTLPTIEMEDLGGGGYLSVAESIRAVLTEILKATLDAGGGKLPTEAIGDLDGALGGAVDSLKDNAAEALGEAAGALGERIRGGIGGLLGRDPTPTPPPPA